MRTRDRANVSVAVQYVGTTSTLCVLPGSYLQLFHPSLGATKCVCIGHVVHDDGSLGAAVVHGSQAMIPLLSCCVPDLKLYRDILKSNLLRQKCRCGGVAAPPPGGREEGKIETRRRESYQATEERKNLASISGYLASISTCIKLPTSEPPPRRSWCQRQLPPEAQQGAADKTRAETDRQLCFLGTRGTVP